MRHAISEFIDYTDAAKEDIWETATFVFDTNVLLNLYRVSSQTRGELKRAMRSVSRRVWLPYHIAWEYMKNRHEVVFECSKRYDSIDKAIDAFLVACKDQLRLREDDGEFKNLEKSLRKWKSGHKAKNRPAADFSKDEILEYLLSLFEEKTGQPYSEDQLEKLFEKGKERYAKQVPPGYKDAVKAKENVDCNQYGDYIIWREILDYSKENQVDIVYVTSDQKEDWWQIVHGKTVGPRVELRKEFSDETGHRLMFYTTESFLRRFSESKGETVEPEVKEELESFLEKPIRNSYSKELKKPKELANWVEAFEKRQKLMKRKQELSHQVSNLDAMFSVLRSDGESDKRQLMLAKQELREAAFELDKIKGELAILDMRINDPGFFEYEVTKF